MSRNVFPRLTLLCAAWLLSPASGFANPTNGDFESGALSPWVLTGAGAVVPGSAFNPPIAPAGGQFMGYITTLNNEGAKDFGFFNESPDIDGDGIRESEYSSLSVTFTASEPCVVSFDLNFLTDEVFPGNSQDINDSDVFGLTTGDVRTGPYLLLSAVASGDGSYTGTAQQLRPADFSDGLIVESNFGVFPTIPDASQFRGQTGFRNYWFVVQPGVHTWTFFVADSHTDGVASALLIDNLRISVNPVEAGPTNFGTVTIPPALNLNGVGSNVDSIAFWEAPNPSDTLMFVTGKTNRVVEVWKYPFAGNELAPITFTTNINGVAVDQDTDRLYVSDRIVSVFSVPSLQALGSFGQGILGVGENNLDLLKHASGETWIYVSDDHNVYRFNAATTGLLGSFAPTVSSIETVLADDFYQMILVPEEQGPLGNPGVFAYHPDGTPFEKNGTNRFGNNGEFDSDEEGILLYTFPANGTGDDGRGFIVVADQRSDVTDFEFFDRQTWAHLGRLRLQGVSNTDGIASTQRALPDYPLGVFAAINNDTSTAVVGWDAIFTAIGWDLAPETVRITPATTGPTDAGSIAFTVVFSEPVTGFNDAADLVVTHSGTAHSSVTITGSGASYTVTLSGVTGVGSLTLAVSAASDVQDLTANAHAASVTSAPVLIGAAYHAWAAASGLANGVDDGSTDDPDDDGDDNVREFATDSAPLSGAASGKMREALATVGDASYFTYTFPLRQGAVFTGTTAITATVDGITYTLSGSADLFTFDQSFVEITPALSAGLPALSAGYSYRTFRMSSSVTDLTVGFIRLGTAPATP